MPDSEIKVTAKCPVRTALELLGGKWKLVIIQSLSSGPKRLFQLKKQIPDISEKMLIQELKILVDSDMVEKIDYQEMPPRVDYSLTERGRLALPLIGHLKDFADDYLAESHQESK